MTTTDCHADCACAEALRRRRELAEELAELLDVPAELVVTGPIRHRRRRLTERGWFQAAVMVGLIALAFGLAALAIVAAGLMTGAGA